jgi:hypothetical protein
MSQARRVRPWAARAVLCCALTLGGILGPGCAASVTQTAAGVTTNNWFILERGGSTEEVYYCVRDEQGEFTSCRKASFLRSETASRRANQGLE